MLDKWVSVSEAATHLGVSKDTIYRWITHRSLPGYRIGRLWKFRLSEIDEWVKTVGLDCQRPDKPMRARFEPDNSASGKGA